MGNPCQALESQLDSLHKQKAALAKQEAQDLKGASGQQKAAIVAQYKKDTAPLNAQIQKVEAQVEVCNARRDVAVTGPGAPAGGADIDHAVQEFMHANGVRAGQLTITKNGFLVLAHAYTWRNGDASYPQVKPGNLMRIASCSKAFTSAAITQLYADPKSGVMPNTKVFAYLGITKAAGGPKQDARVDQITVQNLVDHTGGWNDKSTKDKDDPGSGFDPVFRLRTISSALGLGGPPTKTQIAQFMYGQPLQNAPGAKSEYSNFGYLLLGLVVEKATGMPYIDYVKNVVLEPLGLDKHVFAAPMLNKVKNPLEIRGDDPNSGLTPFKPNTNDKIPYVDGGEGWITELMDSGGGLMTTATTLALFAHNRACWGLGGRAPGSARSGGMAGVSSLMVSAGSDVDYAYIFNSRSFPQAKLSAFNTRLANAIGAASFKPELHLQPA